MTCDLLRHRMCAKPPSPPPSRQLHVSYSFVIPSRICEFLHRPPFTLKHITGIRRSESSLEE